MAMSSSTPESGNPRVAATVVRLAPWRRWARSCCCLRAWRALLLAASLACSWASALFIISLSISLSGSRAVAPFGRPGPRFFVSVKQSSPLASMPPLVIIKTRNRSIFSLWLAGREPFYGGWYLQTGNFEQFVYGIKHSAPCPALRYRLTLLGLHGFRLFDKLLHAQVGRQCFQAQDFKRLLLPFFLQDFLKLTALFLSYRGKRLCVIVEYLQTVHLCRRPRLPLRGFSFWAGPREGHLPRGLLWLFFEVK